MKPVHIVPVGNVLGEGVLWDAQARKVLWTDIQSRRLFFYDPARDALESLPTPERLCSFGLVAGEDRLVAAFESGIALYEPRAQKIEWLARPEFGTPGLRFNDGRVDRQGRFWTGTMLEGPDSAPAGTLYSIGRRSPLRAHISGVGISNGIGFSPDSTRFYFADSPVRTIFVYDFDAGSGAISNRRVFASTPKGAFPDGSTVDAGGCVWNAHWGAGRVVRYAPDGAVLTQLDVPATQPTCAAFGGRDLNLLFVTSARDGLNEAALSGQPHAGDLFIFEPAITGLPDGRFVV